MTIKGHPKFRLGPTGKYPRGKIAEDDEGEIRIMMSSTPGTVRVDFGTELKWFALGIAEAKAFAAALNEAIEEAEKGNH